MQPCLRFGSIPALYATWCVNFTDNKIMMTERNFYLFIFHFTFFLFFKGKRPFWKSKLNFKYGWVENGIQSLAPENRNLKIYESFSKSKSTEFFYIFKILFSSKTSDKIWDSDLLIVCVSNDWWAINHYNTKKKS